MKPSRSGYAVQAARNGFAVQATQLIFDRRGHLRKTVVGDSQDALVDRTVKELAAER
ncbi:MAG: hypothetical protein WAJ85_11020 [Candidatus Baltobacteraceae bacterium]|jgi:hypothetical protein